jgi:hypothetical protein
VSIIIGCIFEILVPKSLSSNNGVVVVEVFELGSALHPDFDMPILRRTSDQQRYATVSSKVCDPCSFFGSMPDVHKVCAVQIFRTA